MLHIRLSKYGGSSVKENTNTAQTNFKQLQAFSCLYGPIRSIYDHTSMLRPFKEHTQKKKKQTNE